ncbi:MAG: hypothetical protein M3068_03480 [Gemmatimonadota bacterium]|nr:hypothetical protein [Gemmatimonadota bacterium]
MNRTSGLYARRTLLTLGALLLCQVSSARAQGPDGPSDPEPVNVRRAGGFRLYGLADFAITGMRNVGNSTWFTVSSGPSDTYNFYSDLTGRVRGTPSSPTGYCCGFFELQLWMTAARTNWLKNRDIAPTLENDRGGGWNARMNYQRWAPDLYWSMEGRDGSVGSLYSGATTEDGTGTCLDMNNRPNDFVPGGLPALAASDCPKTWAGPQFDGERPVPDTVFLKRFQASKATFNFDDWHYRKDERSSKLYGSFQTFGATNDFGREALRKMGNVVPGGVGNPTQDGYPLGIEWDFNVWSYAVPTVADAMFYKATVVNKSAEVYGVGLDYDSLYLGFMVRPFHTTGSQSPAIYAVPAKGAFFEAQVNINATNCYGAVHGSNVTGGYTAGTTIRSCLSNTSSNRGFRGGAGGTVMLKSPIGDLRNKKFTDPTSPFYFPSHLNRGDTLTYNVANACGFTCSTDTFIGTPNRAAFGAYTGNEADALAGRGKTANDLNQLQYFDLFHTQDWPQRWTPSNPTVGGFNKYVPPGNWDWNHDGILDTLAVTTCGRQGCVKPWSDTLPGGFPNALHNKYDVGVGPIKLKAGDSTSFIIAFLSTPDSAGFEALVDNVIQIYQNFWLSPEPPCPTNIVSASAQGGNRQFDTRVNLFFDQSVNDCTDKFLVEQAKALKASLLANDVRLKTINPRLVNQIRGRGLPRGTILVDTVPKDTSGRYSSDATLIANARACSTSTTYNPALCAIVVDTAVGVVDSLFIFKSCDLGQTFTSSSGTACVPSPARDVSGSSPRFPWQAYAKLGRGTDGRFPATYSDGAVTGGVTYTYVVVGQSFAASFPVTNLVSGQLVQQTFTVRPATLNGLSTSTSNRNVATVYVPLSVQAGGRGTNARFASTNVDTTAAFATSIFAQRPVRGTDTLRVQLAVSDSAEVEIFRADTTQANSPITKSTVRLFALADTGSATLSRRIGVQQETFVANGAPVDVAGHFIRTDSVVGVGKYTFFRFLPNSGPNGRGPQVTYLAAGVPFFVTDTLPTTDITPASTLVRSDFPGVATTFDPTRQKGFLGLSWTQAGIGLLNTPAYPTIQWLSNLGTARDQAAYSHYVVSFGDREFGPDAPFRLDQVNPQNTQTAFTNSLNKRKTVSSTDASVTSATALARALGRAITTDSLAALALPFTIKNARTGGAVAVAVLKSELVQSLPLGNVGDTVRVTAPADKWLPGEKLYFVETFSRIRDTVIAGKTLTRVDATGKPIVDQVTRVTWGPGIIGCVSIATCNPVIGVGGTGYTQTNAGEQMDFVYFAPIGGPQVNGSLLRLNFTVAPEQSGAQVASVTGEDLSQIRVVPNPYVMFSQFEQTPGTKRLMFTHLPPKGNIRIYTASGQFVQQINWTPDDLDHNCSATVQTTQCQATGDLVWNMRTREDLELGAGFYVFQVTSDVGGRKQQKLGKFVVIH